MLVFLWNLLPSTLAFSRILNSKSSFRISSQLFLTDAVLDSGVQLVFNSVPLAVGIYILQTQERNLKDAFLAQDKSFKDSMNALEKLFRDNFIAQGKLWDERFNYFLSHRNNTSQ
jgi:hypothetical protein